VTDGESVSLINDDRFIVKVSQDMATGLGQPCGLSKVKFGQEIHGRYQRSEVSVTKRIRIVEGDQFVRD
jgi:hypothetical protein